MRYKQDGFTLIELLVAISILAIVAVLGFRGLDSIIRTRTLLTDDLEQTRTLQITFAQLQSDCLQTVNQLSYPNLPETRSVWVEPRRLILIRNDYSDDQPPAMQVVVYRVNKDNNLTRFETDSTRDLETLKKLLMQAKNHTDSQDDIVMQKDVQDILFRGYPENADQGNVNALVFETDPEAENSGEADDTGSGDAGQSGGPNSGIGTGTGTGAGAGTGAGTGTGAGAGTGAGNPGQGNPPGGSGIQAVSNVIAITGLQVQLQLSGHDKKMYKIFVVGGS